jgi:NTE family protein
VRDTVSLDFALQGGGAHGAFTWGVLDRLLDETWLDCGAISGASAGAMNAVVMANALLEGGRADAQRALWRFWKRISRAAHGYRSATSPFHAMFLPDRLGLTRWSTWASWWSLPGQWMAMADAFTRTFSPYQFNPLNLNPIIDILEESVDFSRLRNNRDIQVFIAATSVRTGGLKIFRNPDLSAKAVMASACLPHLFQAVEIGGEPYWDGGYLGNPALLPLIAESEPQDLLIVQLNPPARNAPPRTAGAILGRLNEITFNASLVKELRGIALLKQALEEEPHHKFHHPLFNQVRELRLHRIAVDEEALDLGTSSKLDPEWAFLIRLHGLGARAADTWLSRHRNDLGVKSTLDLERI